MGLLTKGLLSISVFRLTTANGLDGIVDAAHRRRYPTQATEPSKGWGTLSDNEAYAASDGVQLRTYKGYKPIVQKNHISTRFLTLRYYYDEVDSRLRRRVGADADWRSYYNRGAFDVLFLDEGNPNEITVLAATRNDREVGNETWPAILDLVSDEAPPGSLASASLEQELDPDFFLWLLYMLHKKKRIAPNIKLSGIADMNGTFVGKRNHLSQGVDMTREDSLALVARNRSKLGPAKIAVKHYAEPEGYFELQLIPDGGFQVYRKSSYDDPDLKELSTSESGQRMVQDVWQTLLPEIRAAYASDRVWRTSERDSFVTWAKDELKMF